MSGELTKPGHSPLFCPKSFPQVCLLLPGVSLESPSASLFLKTFLYLLYIECLSAWICVYHVCSGVLVGQKRALEGLERWFSG